MACFQLYQALPLLLMTISQTDDIISVGCGVEWSRSVVERRRVLFGNVFHSPYLQIASLLGAVGRRLCDGRSFPRLSFPCRNLRRPKVPARLARRIAMPRP